MSTRHSYLSEAERRRIGILPREYADAGVETRLRVLGFWPWLEAHAKANAITPAQVIGRSRERHIVAARHEAWRHIYRKAGYSIAGIGRLFGVDHTSVIHAFRKAGGV